MSALVIPFPSGSHSETGGEFSAIQKKLIQTLDLNGLVVAFGLGPAGREWASIRPADAFDTVAARVSKVGPSFTLEAFGETLASTPCIFEAVSFVRSMFKPDMQEHWQPRGPVL